MRKIQISSVCSFLSLLLVSCDTEYLRDEFPNFGYAYGLMAFIVMGIIVLTRLGYTHGSAT